MTIQNEAVDADQLLRVSCPVANFAEKYTVDRGEGAPAMRTVKSIPVPAHGAITLKTSSHHVMLLQTRQLLTEGDSFSCVIVFQNAGKLETEVHIGHPL
jgi:copper(I)-binding protein